MPRIIFILLITCLINCAATATNYYVRNAGNDGANGRSDASAWATLAKVNASTFLPGDTIFFKKGDIWREMLIVPSSGTLENYIVFGSYGTGANPQILGSEKAVSWTNTTGNIWQSATSLPNPMPDAINGNLYFINTDLSVKFGVSQPYIADFSNMTSEFEWTWNDNTIYVYAPSDPDTRYNSIETSQRSASIYLNDQQYIEVNGIDMFYGQEAGVKDYESTPGFSGYVLRNCEIAWIGYPNISGAGSKVCYDSSLVEFNSIHDCGWAGIAVINNSNLDVSDFIFQNNTLFNGYHTTGINITAGLNNTSGSIQNIIIRNNVIYDDPAREFNTYGSNLIDLVNYRTNYSILTDVAIYNNIIKNPAGTGIYLRTVFSSAIFNNTFYGMNQSYSLSSIYQILYDLECGPSILKNNIFYGNGNYDVNPYTYCIYVSASDQYIIDADYNLYYTEDARQYLIGNYKMEDWSDMIWDLQWEENSPSPSDPLFISSTDYHLQPGSPAMVAGTDIPGYTTDFDGNPVSSPPCIGAYQGGIFSPGTIGPAQTICSNTPPALLTFTIPPSGGTGTFTYQWQSLTPSSYPPVWVDILGAYSDTYQSPSILTDTYFRCNVTSGGVSFITAPVLISTSVASIQTDTTITTTSTFFRVIISNAVSPYIVSYATNWIQQDPIENYVSGTNIYTGTLNEGYNLISLSSVYDATGCLVYIPDNEIIITVTGTGINSPADIESIKIYPNPTQGSLYINTVEYPEITGYSLEIINVFGKTVYSKEVTESVYKIDMSSWTGKGLYYVRIIDNSGKILVTRKIILQ